MFPGCTVPFDNNKNKFGRRKPDTSQTGGKNTWVTFNACHAWKCVLLGTFDGVNMPQVPACNRVVLKQF